MTEMYVFTETWTNGGTTIHKGVAMSGPFIETEMTVSKQGSGVFKDIPKSILQPYSPPFQSGTKKKKKI